jgi:hypothetical protein
MEDELKKEYDTLLPQLSPEDVAWVEETVAAIQRDIRADIEGSMEEALLPEPALLDTPQATLATFYPKR